MEKPELFICECNSADHQLVFIHDDEDNMTYVHVHLSTYRGFFKKLKYAIKYVCGYKSRYGAWDEFILKHDDVGRLKEHLDKLKPTQSV